MKNKLIGIGILLFTTIIWGSAFVSQSIAMEHMGPFSFQAIRCAIATVGLLPVIAISDKFQANGQSYWRRWNNKKIWIAGILCGIPLFIACNLQQLGLAEDTDPGKSGFLTAMYVVIVPIIGLFRKKKMSIMIPISVTLAVIGLYFLSCMGATTISLGDSLTLGCALMFAIQITFVDILATDIDPFRVNTIQALVCTILSGAVAIFSETVSWQGIGASIIPLIHVGFFSMGLGYALQIIGQKKIDPTLASLIMSLESVFAVIFGWLLCHDKLTPWETVGCILVFSAVIVSQLEFKRKKPKE